MGEMDVGQRIQTSSIRWGNSGDLIYSMVTTVNNTVLNTWKFVRGDLQCSHHKKIVIKQWAGGVS